MTSPARPVVRLAALLATLACDGGLQPAAEPSSCPEDFVGICGTVRFRGPVPDSTHYVLVVAYETFPRSQGDLFTYQPIFPPQLPPGDTVAFYLLPLAPGTYEWVLAVWKKLGTLTAQNADSLLREAGFYRNPADTTLAGVVVVPGGTSADSIDFVVDYDNMHPVSYWFPQPSPPSRRSAGAPR